MAAVLDFNSSNHQQGAVPPLLPERSKRSKKRKSRSSAGRDDINRRKKAKTKSKKRKKKRSSSSSKKFASSRKKGSAFGAKPGGNANSNGHDNKSGMKDLPIITEEDHEDGSFSDSYIPTKFDASGFFSYHTWGKEHTRPPDEDRVVRSGPSIWHWPWDLSFGLYDDLYDNYIANKTQKHGQNKRHSKRKSQLLLEETWLNIDGPIATWQPLLAAVLWFIIAMNILFPVSLIAQTTPCPDNYYHDNNNNDNNGININTAQFHGPEPQHIGDGYPLDYEIIDAHHWEAINRTIHIDSSYAHLQVGIILTSFEISTWITSPISSFLTLRFGPSWMLFIGMLLMILSNVGMAFTWHFNNINFVVLTIIARIVSGIGFNIVRQSTLFLWSCFAKLDMLSSGLGFCVGPVFGDLLYTYVGWDVAYFVYAVMLFVLLLVCGIVSIFKLVSMEQISRLEIPAHIQNIRKPRYDLFHHQSVANFLMLHTDQHDEHDRKAIKRKNCCFTMYLLFKFEILFVIIVGLVALEPTLPVYALDPSLDITVSGALFTFIYLPLLALSSLIGLIYAKSSSKFLNSAKKHVKKQRRGMKYITKTLSINFSGVNQSAMQSATYPIELNSNTGKRFGVSKSEKIKLVERPSWLAKKKKLLPSPDISQHHIILLLGLAVTSLGYMILSGGKYESWVSSSNGVDLVLGLVLISIGCAFVIISCVDSFINGLSLTLNQTYWTYVVLNAAILVGPVFGGVMLDFSNNEVPILARYWSQIIFIHFAIYFVFLICKYIHKCVSHFIWKHIQKRQQEKQQEKMKKREECLLNARTLQSDTVFVDVNVLGDTNQTQQPQTVPNSGSVEYLNESPMTSTTATSSRSCLLSNEPEDDATKLSDNLNHSAPYNLQSSSTQDSLTQSLLSQQSSTAETGGNENPIIRELSTGKIDASMHRHSGAQSESSLSKPQIMRTSSAHSADREAEVDSGSDSDVDDDEEEEDVVPRQMQPKYARPKLHNANIRRIGDLDATGLKQRVRPKHSTENSISYSSRNKQKKEKMSNIAEKVYIHGTDLRHLCWWKRGLNVRFPYVQWMESGWSSTHTQYASYKPPHKNRNHRRHRPQYGDAHL